ncbi:class I SAM-dependent methyltransferase [Rhodoluna lacicola]|uniref:class I SAM-dependent methyltransferase n=1 Tax=Rhodoluna lacicola TaxID=529884 RepID=UPI002231DF9A|nr:class I SAM-dependent methyltransferase [Rhodoluna lacicola]
MNTRAALNNFFGGTFSMLDRVQNVHSEIRFDSNVLEISPNWAPLVVPEDFTDAGSVEYCDRMPFEWLREREANNPDRLSADLNVIQTTFTWTPGKRLTECTSRKYDYVLSSHVVEHVPDLLGHMLEIADVLRPEGKYVIVLPNAEGSGEFFRRKSDEADIVEHFFRGGNATSPGQNWDYLTKSLRYSGKKMSGKSLQDFDRNHTDAEAIQDAFRCNFEYVDVHCWVFTPKSFTGLVSRFNELEIFPFRVEKILESSKKTADGISQEFVVVLVRCEFAIPSAWKKFIDIKPEFRWLSIEQETRDKSETGKGSRARAELFKVMNLISIKVTGILHTLRSGAK